MYNHGDILYYIDSSSQLVELWVDKIHDSHVLLKSETKLFKWEHSSIEKNFSTTIDGARIKYINNTLRELDYSLKRAEQSLKKRQAKYDNFLKDNEDIISKYPEYFL